MKSELLGSLVRAVSGVVAGTKGYSKTGRVRGAALALALGAGFAIAASESAFAVVVLDQVSTTDGQVNAAISDGSTFGRAQTFTVGIAGILDSVEVTLNPSSDTPTTLRILATAGGVPVGGAGGSTVLATSSLVSGGGGVLTYDLSASLLAISVGEVLAIELLGDGSFSWLGSLDGYAGGSDFFFNTTDGFNNWTLSDVVSPALDMAFRTFVDVQVTAVPEPATLALFGAGLVGLGAVGWRRRKGDVPL